MAGIYLHIPYCRKACHYCNFHFSTTLKSKGEMLRAMVRELELQSDFLGGAPLSSVYLGGGTPSLLDIGELQLLFEQIYRLHTVESTAEITLEANPDDLTVEKLRQFKHYTPVNRLSIGVQSFFDEDLLWMNRAHNAAHARACLENALSAGFQDLTIDLIYGAPTTTDERWRENLEIAYSFDIPHLSCYALTVEPGTALAAFIRKGKQTPVKEDQAARQFEFLMESAVSHGYEQYEISNFARAGRYARHNTSYWTGANYLGIGPAAHSFNGYSRQWNIANNALYIKSLSEGIVPFEREMLSVAQQYNEYLMTSLRTMWGAEESRIQAFGPELAAAFQENITPYLADSLVEKSAGNYRLSLKGRLLADRIAADLFVVD